MQRRSIVIMSQFDLGHCLGHGVTILSYYIVWVSPDYFLIFDRICSDSNEFFVYTAVID